MKVIFLDMDGVLVTGSHVRELIDKDLPTHIGVGSWKANKYKSPFPWTALDPDCVQELNRILDATEARIVISSTWRARGVKEMADILGVHGVNGDVIGATPFLDDLNRRLIWNTKGRGLEIAKWLGDHGESVGSFVILDDDDDMVYLSDHLVACNPEHGITSLEADLAISLLNKEQSKAA